MIEGLIFLICPVHFQFVNRIEEDFPPTANNNRAFLKKAGILIYRRCTYGSIRSNEISVEIQTEGFGMKHLVTLVAALAMVSQAGAKTHGVQVQEGTVSAQALINWVNTQKAKSQNVIIQANGLSTDDGGTGFCLQCSDTNSNPDNTVPRTVSLYGTSGTQGTVFFEADMDIDCDASDNGVCNGYDPSHQGGLLCDDQFSCSIYNNGSVDASVTPFYVIPIGDPMNYDTRGISIGQVAAIINTQNNSITYAPFLDGDGVGQEIGECSPALADILGVDDNPDTGGQSDGITYIIFTGDAGLLAESDVADHQSAIDLGSSLAEQLIASSGVYKPMGDRRATSPYQLSSKALKISASGSHSVSVYSLSGQSVMSVSGNGAKNYDLSKLAAGTYLVKMNIKNSAFSQKLIIQ